MNRNHGPVHPPARRSHTSESGPEHAFDLMQCGSSDVEPDTGSEAQSAVHKPGENAEAPEALIPTIPLEAPGVAHGSIEHQCGASSRTPGVYDAANRLGKLRPSTTRFLRSRKANELRFSTPPDHSSGGRPREAPVQKRGLWIEGGVWAGSLFARIHDFPEDDFNRCFPDSGPHKLHCFIDADDTLDGCTFSLYGGEVFKQPSQGWSGEERSDFLESMWDHQLKDTLEAKGIDKEQFKLSPQGAQLFESYLKRRPVHHFANKALYEGMHMRHRSSLPLELDMNLSSEVSSTTSDVSHPFHDGPPLGSISAGPAVEPFSRWSKSTASDLAVACESASLGSEAILGDSSRDREPRSMTALPPTETSTVTRVEDPDMPMKREPASPLINSFNSVFRSPGDSQPSSGRSVLKKTASRPRDGGTSEKKEGRYSRK